MKPYTTQVQVLGSLAILTLCPDGHVLSEAGRREPLDHVLGLIPAFLDSLVLDTCHLPGSDMTAVVEVVHDWALDRRVAVVTLGKVGPALLAARSRNAEAADLQRSVDSRVLVQRARGISRARELDSPCSSR